MLKETDNLRSILNYKRFLGPTSFCRNVGSNIYVGEALSTPRPA
jgi:hypothetical protein